MIVLAIDPGQVTGWVRYCTEGRRVLSAGQFPEWLCAWQGEFAECDRIVIEQPRVYHGSPPAIGDTCITAGILWHKLLVLSKQAPEWLSRHEVKKALADATFGEVKPRKDAEVWAALKLIHGPGCDKRATKKSPEAGAIGNVKSHERAALAVAVAFAHREGVLSC